MKVFWIVSGVVGAAVLLYAVVSGIRFALLAGKGTELARVAVPFERTVAESPFKVLVMGDSSAVGVGASAPDKSLPGLLSARLPSASIENVAVSGARTSALAEQLPEAAEERYDLVLVQIGGNDVTHVTPIEQTSHELAATLDALGSRADKIIVLTSGDFASAPIWPWPLNVFYGRRNRQLQEVLAATSAEHGATYVSIVNYEDAHGIKKDASFYAADGFHPNDRGYAGWFAALSEALTKFGL